jgi:hypothetical protein
MSKQVSWTVKINADIPDPKPEWWISDEWVKVWNLLRGAGYEVKLVEGEVVKDGS